MWVCFPPSDDYYTLEPRVEDKVHCSTFTCRRVFGSKRFEIIIENKIHEIQNLKCLHHTYLYAVLYLFKSRVRIFK